MIDEKKLIEKLEMLRFFNQRSGRELWQDKQKAVQDIDIENADEILSFAIKSLRKLEWIPCSEDLPPKPKENPVFDNKPLELYLVSVNDEDYPFRAFWNGKFFTDGWAKCEVVAWMPLPEPYQMKGE